MVVAARGGSAAHMVPAVIPTYAPNCAALRVVMKWEWRYVALLGFLEFLSLLVAVL